jgi:hypothetical protein
LQSYLARKSAQKMQLFAQKMQKNAGFCTFFAAFCTFFAGFCRKNGTVHGCDMNKMNT